MIYVKAFIEFSLLVAIGLTPESFRMKNTCLVLTSISLGTSIGYVAGAKE
jgi:hypothetical protein